MAYTLEELSRDVHAVLAGDDSDAGKAKVCELVARALVDGDFVSTHLTEDQCRPRKVLYEDAELGFCICGHVYPGPAKGEPHDHGPAWAIYGLAEGDTEMTDWEIVERGDGDKPHLVRAVRSYQMRPGDCQYYAPGAVHSPDRSGKTVTRLIRVEGKNLDHVRRSNIAAAER